MHACSTRRTVCDATTYVYKKEAVLRCELIVPKIMSGAHSRFLELFQLMSE